MVFPNYAHRKEHKYFIATQKDMEHNDYLDRQVIISARQYTNQFLDLE
jgi:hypothetical protein